MPGKNKNTKSSSISRNLHWVTRPSASIRDLALWGADVLGAPSHITNAVRDVSNRVANLPIIGLDAAYNYATGNSSTWEDAFKEADTNPSALASAFEVFPMTNTESNYSDAQLANQYELRKHSPGKPGQITHDGYRYINKGRYAGDVGIGNFFSPSKVNEWSIGQTSGVSDEEGNTYTSDLFAYDTKDTNNVYLKAVKEGKASPAMFLRGALGVVGAKGYDDGTNSATAIRTRIDTKAQKKAYDTQNKKAEGGSLRPSWDDLSLTEKSEMMKVAIKNGITDLSTIRQKYNEFAEGGPEDELTPWPALNNIEYIAVPDTAFTREKTGAGSIEVMFKDTPKEGYTYNTGYKYPHPKPGHNVIIYNPKENDAQDIRLDALHLMPQDPTYDVLRSELAYYADDSDIAYNARNRMNEDIAKYGHPIPGMGYQDYYNNEVDGFLRNMFIEGTPGYIESKRYYPDKQQLREWNKPLMPYVDRIYNYLTTNKRPANVLPEVTIEAPRKKSLGGPLVDAANYYYKGGPKRTPTREELEARVRESEERRKKRKREEAEYRRNYEAMSAEEKEALNANSSLHGEALVSALDSMAKAPITREAYNRATEKQREKDLEKWHETKNILEGTVTAAELLAAGYGVGRGLLQLGKMGAKRMGRTTLETALEEAVNRASKYQGIMNSIGTGADIVQLTDAVANKNTFDTVENAVEAGAGTAGIVGATNWFRNVPFFGRNINTIDNVLDAAGYGAAAWDLVKQLPPLSGALEHIKEEVNSNNENKVYKKKGPLVGAANYYPGGGLFHRLMRFTPRKRPNTSPTKEKSEKYEDLMYRTIIRHQQLNGGSDPDFDIPYLPDKKILIGSTTTSTNALDSLVKYAAIHNANPQLSQKRIHSKKEYSSPREINKNEMLGLAFRETSNGAWPHINSDKSKDPRALANSNFFTAYGNIPADDFVNDYHYNVAGISRDTPPLLDAFQYYAQGDYNRNDPNHTRDVNNSGKTAWKNPGVLAWWNTSDSNAGKNLYDYWYNKTKEELKRKK